MTAPKPGRIDVYTPQNAEKWNSNGGADITARPWVVNRVAELSKHRKKTLLDIGSGTGRWTKQFAQYMELVRGVDASSEMVRIAEATNSADNVMYVCADFLKTNSGHCDIVTALASLQDFETREKLNQAYEEVANILKSNGHFIFYAPHPMGVYAGGTNIWRTEFAKGVSYNENFPFISRIKMEDGSTRTGSGFHHSLAEYVGDLAKHGFKIVDMEEFFAPGDKVPHALVVDAKIGRRK